ncbi:unnamed protein product [Rhizophagus irregularis]|nr:unnamed protein product [Rhizophagus irregularis]
MLLDKIKKKCVDSCDKINYREQDGSDSAYRVIPQFREFIFLFALKVTMSDWEDNDHDNISVRVAKPNKWDDEDVEKEEDVKDNWDESSDEENEKAKTTTTPAAPPKKKISAAQKAIAKKMINNDVNEEEDELERKRREQQAIKDADMENTKEMFGGLAIQETGTDKLNSKKSNNSAQFVVTKETTSPLDKINPKTKEDFDKFSKLLVDRIQKHGSHHLYVNFINGLVRELCLPLKETEARKIANTLTTLADSKLPKPKKKTNSKPVLQVENFDSVDAADYVEYVYDEFEDFI